MIMKVSSTCLDSKGLDKEYPCETKYLMASSVDQREVFTRAYRGMLAVVTC